MPQIIFEYSTNLQNIDFDGFFKDIHQYMRSLPDVGTCKIRAVPQDNYYIGTDAGESAFAFLRVFMASKEGRTDQFREEIADHLKPVVRKYLDPVKEKLGIKCYPTIEVGTLSKHYYWVKDVS